MKSEEHLKSQYQISFVPTFILKMKSIQRKKIDLTIYLGNDATSDIGVLIEAKSLVINLSSRQLNNSIKGFKKYYCITFGERVDYKNNNIKHLIITMDLNGSSLMQVISIIYFIKTVN